jgi:hypothetical protein
MVYSGKKKRLYMRGKVPSANTNSTELANSRFTPQFARDILSDDPYAGLREIIRDEQRRGRNGSGHSIRVIK